VRRCRRVLRLCLIVFAANRRTESMACLIDADRYILTEVLPRSRELEFQHLSSFAFYK